MTENGARGVDRDFEAEYSRLSERERTLPSGFVVKFRALGVGEWVAIWGAVPTLIQRGEDGSDLEQSMKDEIMEKTKQCIIAASISPRMHNGDPQHLAPGKERPAGSMSVLMLSDEDLADYLKGISEALGFGSNRAKVAADVVNS